jgi:hypothetical protein
LCLAPAALAGNAAVDGATLRFDGLPGEFNSVVVSRISDTEYQISDDAPITPLGGCTNGDSDASTVTCTSGGFQSVVINLFDRDDSVAFSNVIAPVVVDGGDGDDVLRGAGFGDLLIGGAGDDSFGGSPENDRYDGGPGSDAYFQGSGSLLDEGADVFVGGPGVDVASYAGGFDDDEGGFSPAPPVFVSLDNAPNDGRLNEGDNMFDVEDVVGGGGDDVITGSPASNTLTGGGGRDRVDGGPGVDSVSGGTENDAVFGGADADDVLGETGDDGLDGGPGDDNLFGGSGEDGLGGAAGDDNLDGGSGPDVLSGGEGSDTADYATRFASSPDDESFSAGRVVVTLDGAGGDGFTGENDNTLADVENVTTGSGADLISGNPSANGIVTGAGNDIVFTRDQTADDVICGEGFDTVRADGLDRVDTEGEDRCERVEVAGQGSPPPAPPTGKAKPRSLIVKVGPDRDRRRPYKFTTRGSVALPTGVAPATACTGGKVSVVIKRGSKTVSSRKTTLRSDCTFRSSVRFSRKRTDVRGRLKVTVRFLGNATLQKSGRKTRTVRAG